jgi:hypothetical protein
MMSSRSSWRSGASSRSRRILPDRGDPRGAGAAAEPPARDLRHARMRVPVAHDVGRKPRSGVAPGWPAFAADGHSSCRRQRQELPSRHAGRDLDLRAVGDDRLLQQPGSQCAQLQPGRLVRDLRHRNSRRERLSEDRRPKKKS